jgi:hypothetical protein
MVDRSLPRAPRRSQARHRRDVVWQIALPLMAAGVGAVTLMYLAASPARAALRSVFADVSLIFLIAAAMLMGLVILLILAGLCVVLALGLRELPALFAQALDLALLITERTRTFAGRITGSLSSARSWLTSVRAAAAGVRDALPRLSGRK